MGHQLQWEKHSWTSVTLGRLRVEVKLNLLLYNYILLCSNCVSGGLVTCTERLCIGMLLIAKLHIAMLVQSG